MKKKYITKLMIAACLSSALSLNSCIEEVFPESSTATIDQIGKSDQAISAMVNSVVAFINAFRSYGPQLLIVFITIEQPKLIRNIRV